MEKQFDFSLTAVFACVLIWFFNLTFTNRAEQEVIDQDVIQYYSYLPAYFIEKDIELKFLDTMKSIPPRRYWHLDTPEGKHVFKMSMGVAYLYSPFFFIAHYSTLKGRLPADGFSLHYKTWLTAGTVFYSFLALLLLRFLLLKYFERFTVSVVLLVLGAGTNLYCYIVHDPLMSHAYSFFLFSAFLVLIYNWYEKPGLWKSIGLGIVGGLISLIRPTNVIVIIPFLLYGIQSIKDCRSRLIFYKKQWFHILTMIAFAFFVWYPQMLYWKQITGQYFYYSYNNETFFWKNPHMLEVLIGYRKGWLIYTPLMAMSVSGLFLLSQKAKDWRLSLWFFFPLNIYIVSSWWCWWYGGSFGQRPLVDSYPLMAIPLAATVSMLFKSRPVVQTTSALIILFFIHLNMFQTWQYSTSLLHYESMTKRAYWKLLFQTTWPGNYAEIIENPDHENALKGLPERHTAK